MSPLFGLFWRPPARFFQRDGVFRPAGLPIDANARRRNSLPFTKHPTSSGKTKAQSTRKYKNGSGNRPAGGRTHQLAVPRLLLCWSYSCLTMNPLCSMKIISYAENCLFVQKISMLMQTEPTKQKFPKNSRKRCNA